MNDLEMYREQLAICDDRIIDALGGKKFDCREDHGLQRKHMECPYSSRLRKPNSRTGWRRSLEIISIRKKYQDVFQRILRNSRRIQARKLFSYNIVLIGFMGSGKSTISDYLSTVFDMKLVEMDQVIAEKEEMSIPDIFATYGEEYFRNLETNLLKELQTGQNCIISCGGGVALRQENVVEMKKNGRVVLLTASPETIFERVKDRQRQTDS